MASYHNENMEKRGHELNLKRLYTGAAVVTIGTRKALDASAVIDGADVSLPFLFSNRSQRLNSAVTKGIQVIRVSSKKAVSYTIGAIFALMFCTPSFALTSTAPVAPEVKAPVYHTITECVQLKIENCRVSPTITLRKKSVSNKK